MGGRRILSTTSVAPPVPMALLPLLLLLRRPPAGGISLPAQCSPMPTIRSLWRVWQAIAHGWIRRWQTWGQYFRRRGLSSLRDGKPLEPVELQRELGSPKLFTPPPPGGRRSPPTVCPPRAARGGPIMQEVGGTEDARFWPDANGQSVHIRPTQRHSCRPYDRDHHPGAGLRLWSVGSATSG